MVRLLKDVASRAVQDHPYHQSADVERMRSQLANQSSAGSPEERARFYVNLGMGELRLGNVRIAVQHLEKAWGEIDSFPADRREEAQTSLAYNLGVAYLRLGETENCVGSHSSRSCILPIRGNGVHSRPEGSQHAIRWFERILQSRPANTPEYVASRWMLNLAYMTLGQYPAAVPAEFRIQPETFASDSAFPEFPDIAPTLGLNLVDMSGGAIAEDFDGDGLLDLFVSTWDTTRSVRFFRNSGDGSFEDRTTAANLGEIMGGLNLVHADYDSDGDADVLILRGAWLYGATGQYPNSLLRNDGKARFTDVTLLAGLGNVHYPTQTAAWADFNNDGNLDLYVGNEASREQAFPSQLFKNNGDGTFTDIGESAGVRNMAYSKGTSWGDFDEDGDQDLYVSNLGGHNRLYRNNGDETFTDVALQLGVNAPFDSFPTWFWDYNNDGHLDLYVSSYYQSRTPNRLAAVAAGYLGLTNRAEAPRLYKGTGGRFDEVASQVGLTRSTLPMGANFGDLDNDGWLDFYLGTGYPFYDGIIPNVMYRNAGGIRFLDVSTAGGFAHLQKGHAVVFADLDNDGDQDVFEQMGGAYPVEAYGNTLYENPGFGNHWIRIRLRGHVSNRDGIGARLQLTVEDNGEVRQIFRHVNSGGSFGSNPLAQQIGLGGAERINRLEVFWPTSNQTQVFKDVAADRGIEIEEGTDQVHELHMRRIPFKKATGSLPHH